MSLIHRASLSVFADYHQFYLADAGRPWSAPEEWDDGDLRNGVKVTEEVVVICPARNMTVPVTIEVLDREPELDLRLSDHAIQCCLALPTGTLQVSESTGPERLRLSLEPGTYRVRALFSDLASVAGGEFDGEDSYLVQLWPGASQALEVLKQWRGEWRG